MSISTGSAFAARPGSWCRTATRGAITG
ncbi:hypothetical protein R2601_02748 [Salipiger bermudensis HTCC2601]|uniref:Uncharacterized protein n=1 Tax=Salipiger bermudensis (strain DSM 26914 / JCM 13377 / KCTC 12554 / HTCC2601) TaxID=314265 RepID=Q0FWU6_SALBH|nr:hypothetical protein R2601_02748 [Salipiger bermudensis HTCC2601]